MEQNQATNPPKPILSASEPVKKPYDPWTDPLMIFRAGRPYKYQTLEEPSRLIEQYFEECEILGKTPNVAGLSLALGSDYRTMLSWERLKPDEDDGEDEIAFKRGLSQIITRAKTRCAERWFPGLEDRDKARGSEFALKVMGYQDKPENQQATAITINQQNNVMVGNPAHLEALFKGLLPTSVQAQITDSQPL